MPFNYINNYGSVTREEALVFINSGQLPGIQSVNLSYENNSQENKYLGMDRCNKLPNGPQLGNFNLSYFILSDEIILPYTGNFGCNGHILKTRDDRIENFSFTSGYLTNYSCRASINEVPQANASFAIFGNVGALGNAESAQVEEEYDNILSTVATNDFKLTAPSHISINLDDLTSNRVQSFEININIPRLPIYVLGSRVPIAIKYVPPILVDLNFAIEKNDYVSDKLNNYPFLEKVTDLSIILRDFDLNTPVVSYSFDNMMLKSESYGLSVDNRGVYQLGYRNYYL